jgi:hypothetical protein
VKENKVYLVEDVLMNREECVESNCSRQTGMEQDWRGLHPAVNMMTIFHMKLFFNFSPYMSISTTPDMKQTMYVHILDRFLRSSLYECENFVLFSTYQSLVKVWRSSALTFSVSRRLLPFFQLQMHPAHSFSSIHFLSPVLDVCLERRLLDQFARHTASFRLCLV